MSKIYWIFTYIIGLAQDCQADTGMCKFDFSGATDIVVALQKLETKRDFEKSLKKIVQHHIWMQKMSNYREGSQSSNPLNLIMLQIFEAPEFHPYEEIEICAH